MIDERYRVIDELGRGGMGVVVLAEDLRLRRRVAVKFLRAEATPKEVARFEREAELLAQLSHRHVVRVFDLGQHEGRPYFVMEYVEGVTLAEVIAEAGPDGLPVDVAVGFASQIAEAVEAVHGRGVIHRDIKPGNVMIAGGTVALLMDFGLAQDATGRERGVVVGTPQYLAPEDVRGTPLEGAAARRSDLYALGITLYELIAGRPPFVGDDPLKLLQQQVYEQPAPLSELRPDVPPPVERVIMRTLAKDPSDRPGSCEELMEELRAARAEVSGAHLLPLPGYVVDEPAPAATPAPAGPPVAVAALVSDGGPARAALADRLRAALPEVVVFAPDAGPHLAEILRASGVDAVIVDLELIGDNPLELCATLRGDAGLGAARLLALGQPGSSGEEQFLERLGVERLGACAGDEQAADAVAAALRLAPRAA